MLRIVCTVLFVSFFVFVQAIYAQEVFKIGSPLPMTGAGAAFGEKFQTAYTMAIDEINAKGGINGKKIELVIEDTQAKPAVAVTNAKKLISSDKVIALVGGWSSGVALAVAPVAQDNKTPYLPLNTRHLMILLVKDMTMYLGFSPLLVCIALHWRIFLKRWSMQEKRESSR